VVELAFTLTDQPDARDLECIGQSLAEFNESDVGPSGRQTIAVLVHADAALVAGLSGYTAWGWLYVQWLWIAEAQRGHGLAGRILAEAEAEATQRGCHGAYIDTFSPHALRAYQKAGYTVFGELKDFPPGRTRRFSSKELV
jgi:GNAT superfamily N-acetyltransferase